MKKKTCIILVLIVFKIAIGFGQEQQLMAINYNSFAGKPVDSLLQTLPSSFTSMKVVSTTDNGTASTLDIVYPNGVVLYITVQKFKYMNPAKIPPGSTNIWDVNLFRKEAIAYSILYDSSGCVVGCDNECLGCPAAP